MKHKNIIYLLILLFVTLVGLWAIPELVRTATFSKTQYPDEFISVKSFRAKGKRLSTFEIARVEEIEPLPPAEPAPKPTDDTPTEPDAPKPADRFPDIPFEIDGKVEQGTLGL